MSRFIGGSFAPPYTDEKLAAYASLAASAEPEVQEAMQTLHRCLAAWWELPESVGSGTPHASGRGTIVPLDAPIAGQLDELIPWPKDLVAMEQLFEAIDARSHKSLRDAAFHLLWGVKELNLGREPATNDKL